MNIRKLFLFFFLTIISIPAFSQVGTIDTYKFINLPISARVTSLGGTLISTRDNDLNVSFVNPALLTDSMHNNVAMSYINYFADINYGYAAFAKNIRKNENFSAGIQYLNYGKFVRADEIGNTSGTFTSNEMSINLSYARSVFDSNLTVGTTLKTIYSNLDSYTSVGSAIDLGAIYVRPLRDFAIAAVIKDAGYQWKTYTKGNREKLPFEMQIGFSKKPKHVPFRFSLTYQNLEKWDLTFHDPNNPTITVDPLTGLPTNQSKLNLFGDKLMRHIVIGGEFMLTKNFSLRAGYNYKRRKELEITAKNGMTGFSFGFGFRIYKFHVSYGHAIYSLAGASNNFSISFDVNNFYHKNTK